MTGYARGGLVQPAYVTVAPTRRRWRWKVTFYDGTPWTAATWYVIGSQTHALARAVRVLDRHKAEVARTEAVKRMFES